jgi:hypothetical protein
MPRFADFDRFAFIVGAPRCGTTSMSQLLKHHPDVCFPVVKEPHFFAQNDLRGLADEALRERVERDYLDRFFLDCDPSQRVGADCSVTYLYAPEQIEPVLRLWPESRFVIAVRDPMEMLPSLHRRLVYIGDETITRFEDAWAAVPDRAAGRRLPKRCIEPRWLRYDEAGRLGSYVERFFATVGRDRCKVVVFDDLARDPDRIGREVLDFLGLESSAAPELTRNRSSYAVRSVWLQRLLKRPPEALFKLFAPAQLQHRSRRGPGFSDGQHAPRKLVGRLRKRLLHSNRYPAGPQPIDRAVQEDIRDRLKGEIELLGELIGRDLGHWLQPRPGHSAMAPASAQPPAWLPRAGKAIAPALDSSL